MPAVAIALALVWAIDPGPERELSCTIAPNGRVLRTADDCPLRTNALVAAFYPLDEQVGVPYSPAGLADHLAAAPGQVVLGIAAGDAERRVSLATTRPDRVERLTRVGASLVVTLLLLSLPLGILRSSPAPSALPLALVSSVTATLTTALIVGSGSMGLNRLLVLAGAAMPAATIHLGLVFPHARPRLLRTPVTIALPYVAMLVFGVSALAAFERNSGYWPIMVWTVGLLELGAWGLLLSTCGFAAREAGSVVERTRAKVLGLGALVIPAAVTGFVAPRGATAIELLSAFVASAGAGLTIPVALAVSRYNLFSLSEDLRRIVARSLYVVGSGFVVGTLWTLAARALGRHPGFVELVPAVLVSMAIVAVLEPGRARALEFFEGYLTPAAGRLAAAQAELASLLCEPRNAIEIATILAGSIETLRPDRGWIYLREGARLVPVAGLGDRRRELIVEVADVEKLLGSNPVIDLATSELRHEPEGRRLLTRGALLLVQMTHKGTDMGAIVLGAPVRAIAYSRLDLAFITTAAAHASAALHNAQLADDLIASESEAARATFAAGLLHDMAKEVDWIRMIAGRLRSHHSDSEFVEREAGQIRSLSRGVSGRIREFLSTSRSRDVRGTPIARTLERALETTSRLHPTAFITIRATPDTQVLRADGRLLHVITNLLDNAVHASKPGDAIEVVVRRDGDWIVIRVVDEGVGLEPLAGADPFALGFTTRASNGGTGIGLSYCREILKALGGSVELEPNHPRGAVAAVRVPLVGAASPL